MEWSPAQLAPRAATMTLGAQWRTAPACSPWVRRSSTSEPALVALLERCAFHGLLTRPRRSRVETGRWTYDHMDGDTAWKLLVDIQVFRGEDSLRSVILSYWVDGKAAVETTVLSGDRLHDIVATIVRTIQRHNAARVPGVEGIFCHAPVEAP